MSSFKIFHFVFKMSIDCFSYDLCYLRFFYIQSIAWILFENCLMLSHKKKIFEYTPDLFFHYSLCHLLDVRVVREAGVRFALCSHMRFETGSAALNQLLQRPPPPPPPPTASAMPSGELSSAAVLASARPPNCRLSCRLDCSPERCGRCCDCNNCPTHTWTRAPHAGNNYSRSFRQATCYS